MLQGTEIMTFRCSSLGRVLLCNGSITLVPLINKRQGDEGDEGTRLHWDAHTRMVAELDAVGDLGPEPVRPSSVNFSSWISEYYFRFVRDTVPEGWSLECEVALAYELKGFGLSGHIDALALSSDATEAIGFDLKSGYAPADAADSNEQILGYVVLLLEAYPSLKKLTFWIVQPRNDEDEGFERTSMVVIEGDILNNARSSLEKRLTEAIANKYEVNTGPKQCAWCPAAPQCPAMIAERELMKATLTPETLSNIKLDPDDATLAEWVIAGKVLSRPLEDALAITKERIKQNGFVQAKDGSTIRIKTSAGSYTIPDKVAFYRATREIITDDEKYAQTVKPSITETKNMIAKVLNLPKTSKNGQSAESVFDGALRPLCEQNTREVLVFE